MTVRQPTQVASCDYQILVRMIDEALVELGTAGIVDAKKARDQLLDLRSLCLALEIEKSGV